MRALRSHGSRSLEAATVDTCEGAKLDATELRMFEAQLVWVGLYVRDWEPSFDGPAHDEFAVSWQRSLEREALLDAIRPRLVGLQNVWASTVVDAITVYPGLICCGLVIPDDLAAT